MASVPFPSGITQIEILSHWVGFASPPSRSAKLTIRNVGDCFVRHQALEATSDQLPERVISRLLTALARPAIRRLDPAIFDVPAAVIDRHYGSCWTDDYPSHLIQIHCNDGRHITIRAEAQYAFMLPLKIVHSAIGAPYETFDPELSRALADLMPERYLDRDRLAGHLGMLEWARDETERKLGETGPETASVCEKSEPRSTESVPPAESATASIEMKVEESESTPSTENIEDMFQILFGEESAQEAQKAEQSGRFSERLLSRNSLEVVRDLLARGADPSIADDVGQTALMHAAFSPFNRERFRLLVGAGANVNARRRDGLTGLHLACAGGEADAVTEWIRAGADAEARSPDGVTPLLLGATWPRIVRMLLNESAEVNAVDNDGHSGLVYAILHQCWVSAADQIEAMQTLINAGADVNLRDRAGITPLGHAKKVLAEALLEEEVMLAFNPVADRTPSSDWDRRKLAEAIVGLLTSAGAVE
jgi:hypothetical protein